MGFADLSHPAIITKLTTIAMRKKTF
ncbi:hypothetical protein SAJ_1255, partial [Streptococcus agalactiae 18RS21]